MEFETLNSQNRQAIVERIRRLLKRGYGVNDARRDRQQHDIELTEHDGFVLRGDYALEDIYTVYKGDRLCIMPDRITVADEQGDRFILQPLWRFNPPQNADVMDFCLTLLQGWVLPTVPDAQCYGRGNMNKSYTFEIHVPATRRMSSSVNAVVTKRRQPLVEPDSPRFLPEVVIERQLVIADLLTAYRKAAKDARKDARVRQAIQSPVEGRYTDPVSARFGTELKTAMTDLAVRMMEDVRRSRV